MRARIVALVGVLVACTPKTTYLTVTLPPASAQADRLTSVPRFIVVPAVDRRPLGEREGRTDELGFVFATSGGAFSHRTGVRLASDAGLIWDSQAFRNQPPTVATAIASDIGEALASAARRPIMFVRAASDVLAKSDDGAVVVTVMIDHIAQMMPGNLDVSKTKTREGNYEVTTTESSSEKFGPFWTFTFQIELGEVRDHRITRHLVRYAAAASTSPSSYSDAVGIATAQIVDAIVREWAPPPGRGEPQRTARELLPTASGARRRGAPAPRGF